MKRRPAVPPPAVALCCGLWLLAAAGPARAQAEGRWPAEPASASAAPAGDADAAVAGVAGVPAAFELDIEAPAPLARLLRNQLDLSRFRLAAGPDGITSSELDRLVAAAPGQARSLLRTAGYFSAAVTVTRQVQEPAAGGAAPLPRVRLRVEAGPLTRVALWSLSTEGEFKDRLEGGDEESVDTWVSLLRDWPLRPGDPFTQDAWSATKSGVLATLRSRGYPQAALEASRADISTDEASAGLRVRAASGPLYRLGAVRVEGLSRYRESAVLNLVDFGPGTPYTDKRLLDLQERLGRSGLFDGASVTLGPDDDGDRVADVLVRVREAPLQQATLGVGISANTGPRLTWEHTHRRIAGLAWTLRNKGQLGRDERNWETEATSHPLRGGYRALVSGKVEWLDAGDSLTQAWQLRAGASLDSERIERRVFAEALQDEVRTASGARLATAVSGNYHLVWRSLDSVLLPTLGEAANMQVGLGYALSTTTPNGAFGRAYGRFSAYRPVGERWYFTGRLELGHLQAAREVSIPETLRFRAGGDESVRGYAFRSLGPRDAAGVVSSGRMLATASVEMARPLLASMPSVWGAAFVDAGQAADRWADLRPVFGLGVGVRWRSPIGPLRVDVAYGEAVRRLRLHVSVGIAF